MRKTFFLLIAFAALFPTFFVNAELSPGQVTACGVIGSAGYYYLNGNITVDSDPCILIDTNDVVFNGQGNALVGDGSKTAIRIFTDDSTSNVTIKNTVIDNVDTALTIAGGSPFNYLTLLNNVVANTANGYAWSVSSGANNLTIENNNVSVSKGGGGVVYITGYAGNVTIKNNVFDGQGNSGGSAQSILYLDGVNNALISGNSFINCQANDCQHAIYLANGGENVSFINNNVSYFKSYGILIDDAGSHNVSFVNNTFDDGGNQSNGITSYGSLHTIYKNTFTMTGGGTTAIYIETSGDPDNVSDNVFNVNTTRVVGLNGGGGVGEVFSNNVINHTGTGEYAFTENANNLTARNNTVFTISGSGAFDISGSNVTVANNSINCSGSSANAILLDGAGGLNNVSYNVVNSSGDSGIGVYLQNGGNNTVAFNNITSSGNEIQSYSSNNLFFNDTLGSAYPTTISFTYASSNISLKDDCNPASYQGNISCVKVIVPGAGVGEWISLNISYSSIAQTNLVMKEIAPNGTSTRTGGVNTAQKYVYSGSVTPTQVGTFVFVPVIDSAPPQYSNLLVTPANNSAYSPSQTTVFNATWTDDVALDTVILDFNGTNHTVSTHSGSEYYYNASVLAAGYYNYVWYANDTATNWNSTSTRTFVVAQASASASLLLNGSANNYSAEYPQSVNATASCGYGTPTLYRNSSSVSNPDIVTLAAAYYNYTAVCSGNANYSASSVTRFFTQNQNSTWALTHLLNSSATSLSATFPVTVNDSCWTNAGFTVTTQENGTQTGSGTSVAYYVNPPAGTRNFTCFTAGNANYSAKTSTFYAEIAKAATNANLLLNGSDGDATITFGQTSNASCYASGVTPSLTRNASVVSNPNVLNLGFGTYAYNCSAAGNENYSASYETHSLDVGKVSSLAFNNLYLNGSAASLSFAFGNTSNATAWTTLAEGSVTLYRNGSNVSNPEIAGLAVGTWNYTSAFSGATNYSNSNQMLFVEVAATPTPTPSPSANTYGGGSTPTPTPSPSPTVTPSPRPSPTATPSLHPTVSPRPSPSPSLAPSAGATATPTPEASVVPARRQDVSQAISVVQDLIKIANPQNADVREAKRLLALAQEALSRGDYASAAEYMTQSQALLKKAGMTTGKPGFAAGFDWFTALVVVCVIVLAAAVYWFYSRKLKAR